MKASASSNAGSTNAGGASRSSAPAMRSSTSRFKRPAPDFFAAFLGDFDLDFAIHTPRSGALLLARGRRACKRESEKRNNYEGFAAIRGVAIGAMAVIVPREIDRGQP